MLGNPTKLQMYRSLWLLGVTRRYSAGDEVSATSWIRDQNFVNPSDRFVNSIVHYYILGVISMVNHPNDLQLLHRSGDSIRTHSLCICEVNRSICESHSTQFRLWWISGTAGTTMVGLFTIQREFHRGIVFETCELHRSCCESHSAHCNTALVLEIYTITRPCFGLSWDFTGNNNELSPRPRELF